MLSLDRRWLEGQLQGHWNTFLTTIQTGVNGPTAHLSPVLTTQNKDSVPVPIMVADCASFSPLPIDQFGRTDSSTLFFPSLQLNYHLSWYKILARKLHAARPSESMLHWASTYSYMTSLCNVTIDLRQSKRCSFKLLIMEDSRAQFRSTVDA